MWFVTKRCREVLQKVVEVKRLPRDGQKHDGAGGGGTGRFKPQFLL